MIYVLLTFLFSPLLFLLAFLKRKESRNILVIQTAKIGDMVCTSHIFRILKQAYPHSKVTLLCTPLTAELMLCNPHIDEVETLASTKGISGKIRLIRTLRRGRYDICLNFVPNASLTLGAFWAAIPVRLGIIPDVAGLTYRLSTFFNSRSERYKAGEMVSMTYARALRSIGIENTTLRRELYPPPGAKGKADKFLRSTTLLPDDILIGIACSSPNALKSLKIYELSWLIELILQRDRRHKAVLIGTKSDQVLTEQLMQMSGDGRRIIDSCGAFTLAELPELLGRLHCFVGTDSGPLYIAAAMGTPVISIPGPHNSAYQRPVEESAMVLESAECSPCQSPFRVPYSCPKEHPRCARLSVPRDIDTLILNMIRKPQRLHA
ncbi:MAG: glycosyltransferase family 9 protein [Alphaproteobacteria bacterium]|uniref:Glycosyltransferase family 9 protein n=1 Tax=Candidatus Nitrobium versatile TaxID=2884831 RepID=A0A953M2A6_9BACT|nr:glycosyltransferase family 9 protein [Candidatus Nitrobium versatile]